MQYREGRLNKNTRCPLPYEGDPEEDDEEEVMAAMCLSSETVPYNKTEKMMNITSS